MKGEHDRHRHVGTSLWREMKEIGAVEIPDPDGAGVVPWTESDVVGGEQHREQDEDSGHHAPIQRLVCTGPFGRDP